MHEAGAVGALDRQRHVVVFVASEVRAFWYCIISPATWPRAPWRTAGQHRAAMMPPMLMLLLASFTADDDRRH